jgi:hypothetical protein
VGAPEFEELRDLSFALDRIKREEAGAGKMCGTMKDAQAGVSVVATFGSKHASGGGVDGLELKGGEETVGEHEADRFEIHGLIKNESCARGQRASRCLFSHELTLGFEFAELGAAVPGGCSLVSKGFVRVKYGFGYDGDVFVGFWIRDHDLVSYFPWSHGWGAVG